MKRSESPKKWPAPYLLIGRRSTTGVGGNGIGPGDPTHPINRKRGITNRKNLFKVYCTEQELFIGDVVVDEAGIPFFCNDQGEVERY